MKRLLIIVVLFSLIGFTTKADEKIFEKPSRQQLVVDNAGVFSGPEIQALTQKLNAFSNQTSTQVLVYTTNDLQGYEVGYFAQRLGQGWGVGQKGFDNGIVIVFKTKTSDSPGQVTIQTGYGIEPLIPDAIARRIVDNEMIPSFKAGKIYEGFDKAINVCISLTKGEFKAADYKPKKKNSSGGGIIFLIVFFIVIFSVMGNSRKRNYYNTGSRSSTLPFWLAMGMFGAGSRRSGWSNFSSGSGSFGGGGGGGGGFGGFGGGGFGGGGASGSW
jgi:uncharacterized protein